MALARTAAGVQARAVTFTVIHMTGSKAGQTEVFATAPITIGRGEGNLLRFDPHQDDKVSAFHARIEVRDGQVVLSDLDSSNGTLVNGNRIQGSVPLVSGAVLTFGADGGPNLSIQFDAAGAPAPAGASPGPGLAKTAASSGAGKKLLAGGVLGTVVMFFVGCLLFTVVVALNRQVRQALPPWAVRLVRKIPGVNKLMRTPRAPRLPGGIRTPRPRVPSGGSSGADAEDGADEAPPDADDAPEDAPDDDEEDA